MQSVFTDKKNKPTAIALKEALGDTFDLWETLVCFTKKSYPGCSEEWYFTSEKYGWSYRISDRKRVLLYLLPRNKFFKTALVFSQKATNKILESDIVDHIKNEIKAAKVYAEGRGIRTEVKDKSNINDILKLITIKISN